MCVRMRCEQTITEQAWRGSGRGSGCLRTVYQCSLPHVRHSIALHIRAEPPARHSTPHIAGEDKTALAWYQQAELQHARWAMLVGPGG